MGQSTPILATKKSFQGHHSDSPAEGMGAGSKGLKGSTGSPGPCAPPLQHSHHLATNVMKPGQLAVGWSLTGGTSCLSHQGSSFPSGDQQD